MKNFIHYLLFFSILISCHTNRKNIEDQQVSGKIRINQIGYELNGPKKFVVTDSEASIFELINETGNVKYKGGLVNRGTWEISGESVKEGDFSKFTEAGNYRIFLEGEGLSYPFIIGSNIYFDAAIDGLKSFYLQRMSMDIDQYYAGVYRRQGGHPDTVCYFHKSTGKSSGFKSSPGGWYDAGDYGKYIVNASATVGIMLELYEIKPGTFQDGALWIPESGNEKNDLLDEIKYELNWMLTMQDDDGGVFHKLTTKKFEAFVMPVEAVNTRFIIGKSTAATLDFAASMAMAGRLYGEYDPIFAEQCLRAGIRAWNWAVENPGLFFARNPDDIFTGAYNDTDVQEEFFWAAAELYSSTGENTYYEPLKDKLSAMKFRVEESWRNYVDNIGYYSLMSPYSPLSENDREKVMTRLYAIADSLSGVMEDLPYRIPVNHFRWGSNSDFLDASMLFIIAYHYSGNPDYKDKAYTTLDYIFGKNATGYSFITGYGSRTPMHIHHRPSEADGILDPFPGFVVGGPNEARQDESSLKASGRSYTFTQPAKSYIDDVQSFASNEICINWNAPYVFVLGYLVDTNVE